MEHNEHYNLLVSSEPGHWDTGEGMTSKGRFHYHTVEAVMQRFSPMSAEVEARLKAIPAIFACEADRDNPTPARVGRITKIEHRQDGYYLHFEFDRAVAPIPQARLLELAGAFDLGTKGFGDLGSSHWSVKQVDLYDVLGRHGLVKSVTGVGHPADVASGVRHPLAELMERHAARVTTAVTAARPRSSIVAEVPASLAAVPSRRVFIVHGHNVAVREEVARFVATLGLEPLILHEQANQGRTILTKFQEEAATASFAIVLLTGDDRGGVAAVDPGHYQLRARQNVVFEFGFFAGHLGLKHVCALVDGPVEKPSDIDGLVYVSRSGEWRLQLAREMKAAGLPVDPSKLI